MVFGRPAVANDGGSARLYALSSWVERRGGHVLDLATVAEGRAVPVRLVAALVTLVRVLLTTRARYVHLEYPGFPALGVYYAGARPTRVARATRRLAYWRAHALLRLIRAACRMRGRRLVVGIGDLPSLELHLPDRGRLASPEGTRSYEQALLRAADAVWVITPQERDVLLRGYEADASRFVIAPNGNPPVPPPPPRPDGGPVRVVYAGSLSRDREALTEAIREALAIEDADVRVELAGIGGEWVEATFGDGRVTWLGTLSELECFELAAASDVALLVYFRDEPYYEIVHPTKLSLYVAAGTPIASGDAAYIADFIGTHGIGVAAARDEFPQALRRLVTDAGLRRRCAEAAGAIREDYFWDAIFDRAFGATERVPAR